MPMTLSDIRTEVLNALDESSAATTDQIAITVTNAIKQAHHLRCTEEKWPFLLWDKTLTITTVANQQTYSLHQEFLRPFYIRNTTRKIWLTEMPARNIEPSGISMETDVDTDRFTIWGRSPVLAQPSSASVLTIVSSSAADTDSSQAITIRGDTDDGVTTETITPTGTTPAAGSVAFTKIIEVIKGDDWAGTMTMVSNGSAVTNLKLFPTEYARSYAQLNLLYLPTAGETLTYKFYRQPNTLSADNAVSSIPPPFERVLVFDTLLLLAAYDNRLDGGRSGLWREYRDEYDHGLRQSQMEASSLGAEPRFIRDSLWTPFPRIIDNN